MPLGAAASMAAAPLWGAGPKRPNIVLIMADDMGFSDIGSYGSEIATPNLDRLAQTGVRFTQFYNTARCCPTRSSLLTGLYNHQTGIGHMVNDQNLPGYRGFLNDRCVTIAEGLRGAGYRTMMAGKWHVGEKRPHWPVDRGFERYFGLISGASNYWKLEKGRQMALNNEPYEPVPGKFYMTDAITDYATQFMGELGGKQDPFFLYLAYTAPHWPLHAWPEDIAKYRGKYKKGWDKLREERHGRQVKMGIVDKRWPVTARDPRVPAWESVTNQDEWDLRMAVYAAQIDRMDQNIGRVMGKLKEIGQEEHTLILFLADNGGCAEENIAGENANAPGPIDSFTSYRTPWANASNTPFRLYKHWVHEGGISSPLIARWPGGINRHNEILRGYPGHIIDVMATCMDVAGAPYPKTYQGREILPLEGESLMPAIQGKKKERSRPLFWEHEGNRAARKGKWKLVSRHPDQWELYDLEADRTEMRNLAPGDTARVSRMTGMYEEWAKRCNVLPWDEVGRKRS